MKTIDIIPELIDEGDKLVCIGLIPYFDEDEVYRVEHISRNRNMQLIFRMRDRDGDLTPFNSVQVENYFKLVIEE